MDYPPGPMHHQVPMGYQSNMHHPHPHPPPPPPPANPYPPMNPESHTSMWLDDPYCVSTACPSQRDSGFNSRPDSLRSLDSTGPPPLPYEQMPAAVPNPHEHLHQPQYAEMQTVPPPPVPPNKPDPSQVIPELMSLLMEDDPVIVREAVLVTQMLIKEGGESRSEVIRNREFINALLDTFSKDVGDGKITHALANLFHSLSQQQEGLRVMLECGGIPRLLPILEATDMTVNFVITTLHNFLIVLQDQSAAEIERYNGSERLIHLLENSNDKLLTLVSDCLLKMMIYNPKSKMFIQNHEHCIQRLLYIFDTTKYDKLLLTISKLLPTISSGNELIKRIILQCNGLTSLEKHLRTTKSVRIRHNCLITLRNVSNQATRMRDIDSLIQHLTGILLTDDHQSVLYALGILSNLTADNRINKSLLVKLNGVQTLMQKLMMNTDGNDELIEAILCTLRHVTARHDLENEARETIRKSYGIGNIVKILRDKNFKEHFGIVKATTGLIKNLAFSPAIIPYLSEQNAVRKLIELLSYVDRERSKLPDDNIRYQQQWDALIDMIIGALINLAKDSSCRSIMKDMNCSAILVRFVHSPSPVLQQSANQLLKELNLD